MKSIRNLPMGVVPLVIGLILAIIVTGIMLFTGPQRPRYRINYQVVPETGVVCFVLKNNWAMSCLPLSQTSLDDLP